MRYVDIFAGAGGASHGIERATGTSPLAAVEWDERAAESHAANHPSTHHIVGDVRGVDIGALGLRDIDLLWASPPCTAFSTARGGRPRDPEVMDLSWEVHRWAEALRPRHIAVENVMQMRRWPEWGRWLGSLARLGYVVETRELCAADYGAPTTRTRLIVRATRGERPRWPVPTHGPGRRPWRTAREIIDWSSQGRSIFDRPRPLAEKTHRRLAEGYARFCGDEPASGAIGAWLALHNRGMVGYGLDRTIGTVTCKDKHTLCTAHCGEGRRVREWLDKYYGMAKAAPVDAPLPTTTTANRFTVAQAQGLPVNDIRTRFLSAEELAAAQGFAPGYVFRRTATDAKRQIGNSVAPPVAEALARAMTA